MRAEVALTSSLSGALTPTLSREERGLGPHPDPLPGGEGTVLRPLPEGEDGDALDADQANILLRWLHRNLGRPEVVPLPGDAGLAEVAGAVAALFACAQPFQEPDVEAEIVDRSEPLGSDVFDFEEVP